jgi:hypothetical protein
MAKLFCGVCSNYVGDDQDEVSFRCYCGNEQNFSPTKFDLKQGGLEKRSFAQYLSERKADWSLPQRVR